VPASFAARIRALAAPPRAETGREERCPHAPTDGAYVPARRQRPCPSDCPHLDAPHCTLGPASPTTESTERTDHE
jgi:hypothetical protein